MKLIPLYAAGAVLAVVPAAMALAGTPSFAHSVPVHAVERPAAAAVTPSAVKARTATRSPSASRRHDVGDDHGGHRARGTDDGPNHDVGDDHGGHRARGTDDGPNHDVGDDHGGHRARGTDDGPNHDAGDDRGRHHGGDDHGSGGHGSDD
jgi:hypothetical protein